MGDISTPKPLAVSQAQAAKLVGISRSQFWKEYIRTGRVKALDLGARGTSVLVSDLEAAIAQRAAEQTGEGA